MNSVQEIKENILLKLFKIILTLFKIKNKVVS